MDNRDHRPSSRDASGHRRRSRTRSAPRVSSSSSAHTSSRTRDDRPPLSHRHSSRTSSFSSGPGMSDGGTATTGFIEDIRHGVMTNYLYQNQCTRLWVDNAVTEGVLVRKARGEYESCPINLVNTALGHAVKALNVECAMTVSSRVIKSYLEWAPDTTDVPLTDGQRIQMVPTVADLVHARKAQCAAFISEDGLLVVWDDNAMNILQRATKIEQELMKLVWSTNEGDGDGEVKRINTTEGRNIKRVEAKYGTDLETGGFLVPQRPVHVMNSFLISITILIVTCSIGAAVRSIVDECRWDGFWPRVSLLAMVPLQITFTLFFAQVIFGSFAQMFGPVRQLTSNSKFFSGMLPVRLEGTRLPHVTIQCPVYKEGLQGVIVPTVRSLKEAMTTYELQGGSCNLFVNDDGLQLLDPDKRQARIDFYLDSNIGYVARPPHSNAPGGFKRRGKFKKASNMNFALMISNKIEDKLLSVQRGLGWNEYAEEKAYRSALQEVIRETGGVAWADGNIRLGDYILLVDSDTRVPADCLLDAVSEMEQSPEVGIMQFSSGVLQVVHNFFENGITFFTNLIYSAIRFTVANGDVAPFVGHNAVLRWSALQEVSYVDADGYEKFWSESHVSEDFDMSLRLQCVGYIIRLASWAGDGFKEGVSLTVYDELARWEKYAYGCNELLFNPIRTWLYRGPLTPLFRKFLASGIPMSTKITVISYVGTYYAIAAAWVLTTVNYFLKGWYSGLLDKYYLDSWQVWFSIVIVFNGLGNVGLAAMRARIGERGILESFFENIKWTVMLAIFLGGLSLHMASSILAHMFEIDMQWGATAKEYEASNFWQEMPKIFKRFKFTMIFSFIIIVLMIILGAAPFVPWGWEITDFVAILPMATVVVSHVLLPIALNPELMKLQF